MFKNNKSSETEPNPTIEKTKGQESLGSITVFNIKPT